MGIAFPNNKFELVDSFIKRVSESKSWPKPEPAAKVPGVCVLQDSSPASPHLQLIPARTHNIQFYIFPDKNHESIDNKKCKFQITDMYAQEGLSRPLQSPAPARLHSPHSYVPRSHPQTSIRTGGALASVTKPFTAVWGLVCALFLTPATGFFSTLLQLLGARGGISLVSLALLMCC